MNGSIKLSKRYGNIIQVSRLRSAAATYKQYIALWIAATLTERDICSSFHVCISLELALSRMKFEIATAEDSVFIWSTDEGQSGELQPESPSGSTSQDRPKSVP
jgi:hypothetical protein